MPNIKSAKKRVLVTEKKTAQNKMIKSSIKTATKKFVAAVNDGDKTLAEKLYKDVAGQLDSACSKGIIHKNNAANKKSGLAKRLSNMSLAPVVEAKVEAPVVEAKVEEKTEAKAKATKKTTTAKTATKTAEEGEEKPKTTRAKKTTAKVEEKTDAE